MDKNRDGYRAVSVEKNDEFGWAQMSMNSRIWASLKFARQLEHVHFRCPAATAQKSQVITKNSTL